MNSPRHPASGLPDEVARDEALMGEARTLVDLALREDLGSGDVTSRACLRPDCSALADVVARADGVLAGLWLAVLVYDALRQHVTFNPQLADGQPFRPGDCLGTVSGPAAGILAGERVALNFVQRLSGVATLTRAFIDAVRGTRAAICDTRKTTPGWRRLEKYAVRCGGGVNHRIGLYDELLIKDNHLALAGSDAAALVRQARDVVGPSVTIEVEVETIEQLQAVLGLPVDMILLDNMSLNAMRQAVALRDGLRPGAGGPLLEASGGVRLETVRAIAETGVDRISVGALTHSAPAVDIAMDVRAR